MYVFVESMFTEHPHANIRCGVTDKINKDPISWSLLLGHKPRLLQEKKK